MSSKIEDPPYIYYTEENVDKATANVHYVSVQRQLTERALELIELDNSTIPPMVLDVGCGTAISGQLFVENNINFVGVDIAPMMLLNAIKIVPPQTPNSFVRADAGQGLPFRAGVFDAAIGIDIIRWLFANYDGCEPSPKRLRNFFESLHGALRCGARAIFNFHPETTDQAELLSSIATRCGFGGGIHTDFPNSTKARVHWLVLEVGGVMPDAVDEPFSLGGCLNVDSAHHRRSGKKKGFNKVEWIKKKKERQRLLGKKVANDSKYTGRSRRRWI
ncbi:putative methyltransferase WBSCR22 like protein [Tritrichomonas foetus]|uniref:Methyltransferase WBSCR22 like protein n=1 Tax=Tritrichomonas foetus TaxID=1144522 RepID=A0A1J4KRF5_9EUKA|nr:putative methyltransferase WBSCR22 like protein [Tritrichomonas foetus]|eukprot:OHT13835.1 putative methyltransferase WBSCR22 like protein [Tritrichomonas foetus]